MITKQRTVHYCEFCKKKMFQKSAMELHEKWCLKNPAVRPKCFDYCKYLVQEDDEYYIDDYMGGKEVKTKCFKCTKLNKVMYSPIAAKKGYPERFENFWDQEPMPTQCDDFISNDFSL